MDSFEHDDTTAAEPGFVVMVGAPAVAATIPARVPVLVIDADGAALQALRDQLMRSPTRPALSWQTAAISADARRLSWFRFNDRRLDGPWEEAIRVRRFPNARQTACTALASARLDTILDEWRSGIPAGPLDGGTLLLRQGDPLQTLQSSGAWLRRFDRIELLGPGPEPEPEPALAEWLEAHGFSAVSDDAHRWDRDRLRSLACDLAALRQEREALEERLSDSAVRLLLAAETQQRQQEQVSSLEGLLAEREAHIHNLNGEAAQRGEELERLGTELEQRGERVASLEALLAEREAHIHNLNGEAAQRGEELERLGAELEQRGERVASLEALLAEREAHIHNLNGEAAQRGEELERLGAELEQRGERVASLEALLAEREAHIHNLNGEAAQRGEELERLGAELGQRGERVASLEALLAEREAHIHNLNGEAAQRQADHDRLRQQLTTLQTTNKLLVEERDTLVATVTLSRKAGRNGKHKGEPAALFPGATLRAFLHDHAKSGDKWEAYFPVYDRLLSPYINRKTRLLEVGVQNGGSLECWSRLLGPEATIVGLDIDPNCGLITYETDNIHCYIGDATNPDWTRKVADRHGPFDVIIDDGSHQCADVISTFSCLFPRLRAGGIYVVEDLHCSYLSGFGGSLPGQGASAMTFFQALTDLVNLEHWSSAGECAIEEVLPNLAASEQREAFLSSLLRLESLEFHNSMVVVRLRSAGINRLGTRVVSDGETLVDSRVIALRGTTFES